MEVAVVNRYLMSPIDLMLLDATGVYRVYVLESAKAPLSTYRWRFIANVVIMRVRRLQITITLRPDLRGSVSISASRDEQETIVALALPGCIAALTIEHGRQERPYYRPD